MCYCLQVILYEEERFMKKQRHKCMVALFLIAVMLTFVFSGCSKDDTKVVQTSDDKASQDKTSEGTKQETGTQTSSETSSNINPPGTLPIVKEPITLTIGIQQHATVEDWETNKQTLHMEERTNINLDFIVYPLNEMNTKLELIIAAGGDELPEVLMGSFSQNLLMPWAEAGMIIPVTDYYDTHAYFMKESLAASEDYDLDTVRKYITYYDGQIYGVFTLNETQNNQYSQSRLNIYTPWLDKLGLDIPKTTDDLYNVLVAFKNEDPNGNGKADEIPLMASTGGNLTRMRKHLMTPFVYTQDNYWIVENGKIDVAFRQEGWREGLKYVNKLYKEGLIDPTTFTQDETAMTITLSQDPHVVGSFYRISTTNMSKEDPDRYLFYRVEQLQGPDGEIRTSVKPAIPGITGVITKNCENVEAAFMLLDYMTGIEMSTITRYGYEGETWHYTDNTVAQQLVDFWDEFKKENGFSYPELYYGPGTVVEPPERVFDSAKWGTLQNTWWQQVGPNIMTEALQDKFATVSLNTELEKMSYVNEYRAKYALREAQQYRNNDLIVAGLLYNNKEQEVITDYYSEIITYVEECWAAFVTGRMNINDDAVWDEYLSTLEKMNLEECIAATQSCYDRMNK